MAGTSKPRTLEEWQHWVERTIAEGRRAPIALITQVQETVTEQGETILRTPAAPVEITYQTQFYVAQTGMNNRLTYRAVRLMVDFPDVVRSTDAQPIAVERYELWGIDETPSALEKTTSAVPGKAYPGMTIPSLVKSDAAVESEARLNTAGTWVLKASSVTSSFRVEDFVPGSNWRFRIRAIGEGQIIPGRWSAEFTVLMEADDTPPNQPSAPVVESVRGQLRVTYNGQSVNGPMPADMSYVVLAAGPESSPTTEVARFGREGGVYIATGIEYYDTQFFRLQAVDEAGNRSPWSEQAFGYPEPLVDTDIILSEIDGAKTYLHNVDAGVAILDDTILTKHLRVTEDMTAAIGKFLRVKAGQIDVNDLWADTAFFGLADALLVRSDMFIGKAFEGGTFTLTQGGKFQTTNQELRGIKVDANGIHGWNPSGTQTIDFDAATGNGVLTGTFYTDLTGSRVRISDREGISAIDLWADDDPAHGAVFHFRNPTSGARGTQLTHFPSSSETTPSSFIQFRDNGLTMMYGDYVGTRYFEIEDIGIEARHDYGEFWIHSDTTLLITRTSSIGNPYVELNGNVKNVRIGTGVNGADPNNYGFFFLANDRVFLRARSNNTNKSNGFDAYVNGTTSDFAQMYVGDGLGKMIVFSNSASINAHLNTNFFAITTSANWSAGPNVDIDGLGRGRINGIVDKLELYSNGTAGDQNNWWMIQKGGVGQMVGGVNVFGNFNVFNGTKNFVMPHPYKIGRELVHAATESPYSGIHYWGTETLNEAGFWIVKLPDYFEHIAAKDHRLVEVTSPTGKRLVWDHEIVNGEFMVEGEPGTPFGWQVLARREGYEFEVEPWVTGLRNAGEPEPSAEAVASARRVVGEEVLDGAGPKLKATDPPKNNRKKDRTPDGRRPEQGNRDSRSEAGRGNHQQRSEGSGN